MLHRNYNRGIIGKTTFLFCLSSFLTDGLFEDPEINNFKIFAEPHSSVHLLLATDLGIKQDIECQENRPYLNRPCLYSRYWTGTLECNGGSCWGISLKIFAFENTSCII